MSLLLSEEETQTILQHRKEQEKEHIWKNN